MPPTTDAKNPNALPCDDEEASCNILSLFCLPSSCLGKRTNQQSQPPKRRTDGQGGGGWWSEGIIQADKAVHETTSCNEVSHHTRTPTTASAKPGPARAKKQSAASASASASKLKISHPYDFRQVSSGTPFSDPTTTQVQQLPPALLRGQRLYRDLEPRNFSPSENPAASSVFSFSKRYPLQSPVLMDPVDEHPTPKRTNSMPSPPNHRKHPDDESAAAWASLFLPTWPAKPEAGHRRSTSASIVLETEKSATLLNGRSVSSLSFHLPRRPTAEATNHKPQSTIYENDALLDNPNSLGQSKSCTALNIEPKIEPVANDWAIQEKKVLLPGQPNRHGRAPSYTASDLKTARDWPVKKSTIQGNSVSSILRSNIYGQSKSCTALNIQIGSDKLAESYPLPEKKVLLPNDDDRAPPYTVLDSKPSNKQVVTKSTPEKKVPAPDQSNGRGHSRSYTASDFRTAGELTTMNNSWVSRKNSVIDPKRQGLHKNRSSTLSPAGADKTLKLDVSAVPLPVSQSFLVPYRFKFQPQRQSLFSTKSQANRNSSQAHRHSEISSSIDSMAPRAHSPPSEADRNYKGGLRPPQAPSSPTIKSKSLSQVASWLFSSPEGSSGYLIDPVTPLTHPASSKKDMFPPPANLFSHRFSEGSVGTITTCTDDDRTIQSVWSLNGTTVGMGKEVFIPRTFPADRKCYSSPLSNIGAAV